MSNHKSLDREIGLKMARGRRRLSPEHRAALQAGLQRWRDSQLPHGIPEHAVNPRVAAMQAGRAAARARREEIRARRLANLTAARQRRWNPPREPTLASEIEPEIPEVVPEVPLPEPQDERRRQPEGLRRYQEEQRRRKARQAEILAEARERSAEVRERDREYYSMPFVERMLDTMQHALERSVLRLPELIMEERLATWEAEQEGNVIRAVPEQQRLFDPGERHIATIYDRINRGDESIYRELELAQNLIYNRLASALQATVERLHDISEEAELILFAKRVDSDRWARVTPAFIEGCRRVMYRTGSPYTHSMDWTLNGSKTELLNESLRYVPFPAPIIFHVKEVPFPTLEDEERRPRTRRQRRGSWAPWKNAFEGFDLTRYQIDDNEESVLPDEAAREHCLIYALRQTGRVDWPTLQHLGSQLYGRSTTLRSVRELAERFELPLKITVYTETSTNTVHMGPRSDDPIRIGLFDDHFFVDEAVSVSSWVLENPLEAALHGPMNNVGWAFRADEDANYVRDPHPITRSGQLLRRMKELGLLVPIRGNDPHAMTRAFYSPQMLDENDLSYCPRFCKPIELKPVSMFTPFLWFADFETTTDGDRHLPFMLCAISEAGDSFETSNYGTTAENVEEVWSNKLLSFATYIARCTPRGSAPIVYFHNLNYDMAFILPFMPMERGASVVEINNRIIGFKWFCPLTKQTIQFRDSYAMISAPLRDFGKMFGLTVEKEIFPYTFYTTRNFELFSVSGTPTPPLDVYLSHYDDQEELETKLCTLGFATPDGYVHAHGYALYYCAMDCRVLRDGFLCFRRQLLEVTGLDCTNFLTLPSTAYSYLINSGVFEGCYDLAGAPLFFIRRCVLGGRCMLQRNQKRDVTGDIADFDAVSLYPSAMARIYTLKGLPKIIEGQKRELSFLRGTDGFFAQVHIRRVGKRLDFPLLAQTNAKGIMEYSNEPGTFYTDDISLANIMQAHQIRDEDVEVLRGYYYDEGRNYRIREVITHLFEQRLKLKKEGNPLEQAYKLLMNSCYGKSIMKPITTEHHVLPEDVFHRQLLTSCCETLTYKEIGSRYLVTKSKNIVSAHGFPSFGVHVLAMSKVIMSEVMVLAQDMGIDVYYTDTDSIHLDSDQIERLAAQYREIHGRELIGKKMGQFHTDFPNHPETGNPTTSRRFIGVGKKAYVDELIDRVTGKLAYHTRLKGIPSTVIQKTAEREYGGDVMRLYEDLYDGKMVSFDLLDGRISFALNNDLTYVTRTDFTRTVHF